MWACNRVQFVCDKCASIESAHTRVNPSWQLFRLVHVLSYLMKDTIWDKDMSGFRFLQLSFGLSTTTVTRAWCLSCRDDFVLSVPPPITSNHPDESYREQKKRGREHFKPCFNFSCNEQLSERLVSTLNARTHACARVPYGVCVSELYAESISNDVVVMLFMYSHAIRNPTHIIMGKWKFDKNKQ